MNKNQSFRPVWHRMVCVRGKTYMRRIYSSNSSREIRVCVYHWQKRVYVYVYTYRSRGYIIHIYKQIYEGSTLERFHLRIITYKRVILSYTPSPDLLMIIKTLRSLWRTTFLFLPWRNFVAKNLPAIVNYPFSHSPSVLTYSFSYYLFPACKRVLQRFFEALIPQVYDYAVHFVQGWEEFLWNVRRKRHFDN